MWGEAPRVAEAIGVKERAFYKKIQGRRIDEVLKDISVHFRVHIYRWNEREKRHEKPYLHYDSREYALEDLLTNGGRDLIHQASFLTGTQPAALTYYAITNAAGFTPAATDTTLTGEITTPSGLARHQPTGTVDGITESIVHTAGTNTTTVTAAFKNNGATAVTGIQGYGNFNAATGGTLGTESAFTAVSLNPNDILKLTVTITLG
jgi:hypothetical protein